MNIRQRRGAIFLVCAAVLLLTGISALAGYVRSVNEQVGEKVSVAMLDSDVPAYTPLTGDDVQVVQIPRRWAPDRALSLAEEIDGKVAPTDLRSGTYLTQDLLLATPELGPGQREIAILIDAETGVAGKVRPGSRVDIVATFSDPATEAGVSEVIVADARVLEIGELRTDGGEEEGEFEKGRVVPVTFALSVREALVLTHAESFARQVRLALIDPSDDTSVADSDRTYTR